MCLYNKSSLVDMQMVEGLKVTTDKTAAAEQIKALYHLFVEKDCTMVEVSSFVKYNLDITSYIMVLVVHLSPVSKQSCANDCGHLLGVVFISNPNEVART